MSPLVAATRYAPLAPRQPLTARLLSWMAAAVDAAFRAHARRRDEQILLAASDHLLHDIGIARADVPRAVREGR